MRIAAHTLEISSNHTANQREEVRESLRLSASSQNRPEAANRLLGATPLNSVEISDAGIAAQKTDVTEAQNDLLENDPRMMMIRSMIEFLTGKKIKILSAAELKAPPAENVGQNQPQASSAGAAAGAGISVEYDYHRSYSEIEETNFSASGTVHTTDGKSIEFNIQLSMQRSYSEETNISLRMGDAVRKQDPLVINFNGNAAQLTDARFKFDLNADGIKENINFVHPGSGFLVFDRNGDGKANDGSELFGPTTGNGFNELAAHDGDRNGWIDENDAIYEHLRLWTKDAGGKDSMLTLQEANVGAISLANVATSFDLKDADNQMLGQIRSTSIYLKENGGGGTVQQIDLTV